MMPAAKFGTLSLAADKIGAPTQLEEEVKLAEIESSLRQMCVELMKPSIIRASRVETELVEHKKHLTEHDDFLKALDNQVQLVLSRSEYIQVLKTQLEDTAARLRDTDARLSFFEKQTGERCTSLEQDREGQHSLNDGFSRGMTRITQDCDDLRSQQNKARNAMDAGIQQCQQQIRAEVASVKLSLSEMGDRVASLNDDVWGPEVVQDTSPPSLRRLDMQMRKVQSRLVDALSDLTALRRLDQDMVNVTKDQDAIRASQEELGSSCRILRERVEKIGRDVKIDSQQAANTMAAYTASLVRDVQGSFGEDVKALQGMQGEMRVFVSATKSTVSELEEGIQSLNKHLEASLREVRVDVESVDVKRKKDKQVIQEDVSGLQAQMRSSLEAAESTLKGLEHIAHVLGMSLQSERVSIALDVQDFVDRKDTPYVGVKAPPEKPKPRAGMYELEKTLRRKEGLDPTLLMRLSYQPQRVSFQGSDFDRSQLLALREKLVHAAQQVLLRGPSAGSKGAFPDLQDGIPEPLVPHALGAFGDIPPSAGGRRSAPPGSRPGSRAQPSARGSPMQEGEPFLASGAGLMDARQSGSPEAGWDPVRRLGESSESTFAGGTHLPSLSLAESGPRTRRGSGGGGGGMMDASRLPLTAR